MGWADNRRVWLLVAIMAIVVALLIPVSRTLWGIDYDYTLQTVTLGGAILGIVSGVLGCFAVLRRESLIGDALSHAALPGVGLAFLFFGRDLGVLLLGAGIASWFGVYFIYLVTHTTRLKQDVAMGIVLVAWFALGMALLVYIQARPDASQAGLSTFIFGQAASIVARDIQLISSVGLGTLMVLALFWKEFKLITFDPNFAQVIGVRMQFFNLLLSTLIVVAIVLGLQLAGVILMVGLLIAPGIAARQWTHHLGQMVVLAALFGAFSGGTGAILSATDRNLPTGPMIIIVAFSLVLFSMTFAPQRGLLWSSLHQRTSRRRFAELQILRDIYKYASDHGGETSFVPDAFLLGVRRDVAYIGLKGLQSRDMVQRRDDAWSLTPKGIREAVQDNENQRLWDVYRHHADALGLAFIAEERQVSIRRLLSRDDVVKLEQKLQESKA